MSNKFETDVVIIGAGPVGLFAIFECGMLKMRTHVVDTLDFVGGQCTALYPEKPIYDIPAHPSIDAADLISNLEKQAEPFSPTYHLGQQVTGVTKNADGSFKVITSKNVEITAKAVIIAAGCGAFGPNRPPLERLEEFEKTGAVAYMVRKKDEYKGKKVMIAGGGDSAVDWALSLADIAEKVYFIHRRPKFRAAPESVSKLEKLAAEGKVEMVIPYQLKALHGENGKLTSIEVEDLDQNTKSYEADHLLAFFGLSMELGPIANWGLNFSNQHIAVEASTAETSEKGIFAVGDICNYKGKLKLIACGFAEAAVAAHAIYPMVHDKPLHFEYSTTKGVPLDKAA